MDFEIVACISCERCKGKTRTRWTGRNRPPKPGVGGKWGGLRRGLSLCGSLWEPMEPALLERDALGVAPPWRTPLQKAEASPACMQTLFPVTFRLPK